MTRLWPVLQFLNSCRNLRLILSPEGGNGSLATFSVWSSSSVFACLKSFLVSNFHNFFPSSPPLKSSLLFSGLYFTRLSFVVNSWRALSPNKNTHPVPQLVCAAGTPVTQTRDGGVWTQPPSPCPAGGRQGKLPVTALEALDLEVRSWTRYPCIPSRRAFSCCATNGRSLFSLGGLQQPGPHNFYSRPHFVNTMEEYDLDQGKKSSLERALSHSTEPKWGCFMYDYTTQIF